MNCLVLRFTLLWVYSGMLMYALILVGAECGAGADGVPYGLFFVAGDGLGLNLDLALTRSHTQYYRFTFGSATHIVSFEPCLFFFLLPVQAMSALVSSNGAVLSKLSLLLVSSILLSMD